jgi:hypothetical protein
MLDFRTKILILNSAEIGVCGFCFKARQLNLIQSEYVRYLQAPQAPVSANRR